MDLLKYITTKLCFLLITGLAPPWHGIIYATTTPLILSPELKRLNEEDKETTNKINNISDITLNKLLITDIFKIKIVLI